MRKIGKFAMVLAAGVALFSHAQAADLPTIQPAPAPAPGPTGPPSCANPTDFFVTDCALSWYGITVYGAVDLGVGWQSHGTPFNASIISGVEELISKNSNHAQWLPEPGGLTQSFIGIKGKSDGARIVFRL